MRYKILYGPKSKEKRRVFFLRNQYAASLVLLTLIFATYLYWPEGTCFIREYLLPSDVVTDSLQQLIWELETGIDPLEAVGNFCQDIFT